MRVLSRRIFVQALPAAAVGLLVGCGMRLPILGKPSGMPRVGYLSPGPREAYADRVDAFLQGLREQPTLFDLIINTTSARALRLTIPATVAALVTELI